MRIRSRSCAPKSLSWRWPPLFWKESASPEAGDEARHVRAGSSGAFDWSAVCAFGDPVVVVLLYAAGPQQHLTGRGCQKTRVIHMALAILRDTQKRDRLLVTQSEPARGAPGNACASGQKRFGPDQPGGGTPPECFSDLRIPNDPNRLLLLAISRICR